MPDRGKLETGWGRIFKTEPMVLDMKTGEKPNLRFTLDYTQDAEFFSAVIEQLGEETLTVSDKRLVKLVEDKELFKINAEVNEEYWRNFNKEVLKEKDAE
jgi:spore coat polysaccharide biosynthesis protein SpsF (cytidylyltransferase family)